MTTVEATHAADRAPSSRDRLHTFSLVLVAIGLFISGYLSYVKLVEVPMVCVADSSIFNCEVVQNSIYSRVAGIPIAWLGFGTYIIVGLLLVFERRSALLREYGIMLVFGVTLFAFLYSVYLVYLQFFVLRALCPWCLGHEITMTVLFAVSTIRLRRSLRG